MGRTGTRSVRLRTAQRQMDKLWGIRATPDGLVPDGQLWGVTGTPVGQHYVVVTTATERAPTRGRPSAGPRGRNWQMRRLNSLKKKVHSVGLRFFFELLLVSNKPVEYQRKAEPLRQP